MKSEEIKLPIKLEELLKLSFNFDNLIKTISFMHNTDLNITTNYQNLEKRVTILEYLKGDINEIKIQAKNIQNTNDNLNRSMQMMQEKLLKMDSKINELEKKSNDHIVQANENQKKLESYGKNIDHLNKVVEDNVKKIVNFEEEFNKNKKELEIISEKIPELAEKDKDLESLIHTKNDILNSKINDNKNIIDKMNNNLFDLNALYNNLKKELDIKNKEIQARFANIIETISSGVNLSQANITNNNNKDENGENNGLLIKAVNDNLILNSTLEQIQNEQQYFKNFISKYNEDKGHYDNILETNTDEISKIKIEINKLKEGKELVPNKGDNIENINFNPKNFVTNDQFKKINDNIRIITSSISSSPKRDEFDKEIRKINSRLEIIELIQQGVTSGPRTMIKSDLVQKDGDKANTYLTQAKKFILSTRDEEKEKEKNNLKKLIIHILNEEIKNINILENPKFFELYEAIVKCKEDISKNDKSIINIRNLMTMGPSQNDITNMRTDLERINEESKKKINEIILTLNGDEEEESEDEYDKTGMAGLCIKKKIELLVGKYEELFNKFTNLQNKSNSLSKEIKEEVKQNLKTETLKAVSEFKLKLDNFTNKFENELKKKIDSGGLTIFEDRLNTRIRGDLKAKLDRSEMKRNNNQIRKKIDSLENKISKTLVDTIIDLQMDEAPLLIKKNSRNYEMCASCNQPIKKESYCYCNTDTSLHKNSGMNSTGINNFRNNNIPNNLKLYSTMNKTNTNFHNKKLPGISSYNQSK